MLKLLIADGAVEFRDVLAEMLDGAYEIKVCSKGNEVLPLLRSFKPDLMILDMMLPWMDGITLLETAQQEGIMPVVMATTSFSSEYVIGKMEKIGISYLMIKPCDLNAVVLRLADLASRMRKPADRAEVLVPDMLMSLGISSKLRGYIYLQHTILDLVRQPGQLVTKELYPAVAKRYGATGAQVERSIRSAITTAWDNRDEMQWRQYFCADAAGEIERPTNAEFITCLAEYLHVRLNGE